MTRIEIDSQSSDRRDPTPECLCSRRGPSPPELPARAVRPPEHACDEPVPGGCRRACCQLPEFPIPGPEYSHGAVWAKVDPIQNSPTVLSGNADIGTLLFSCILVLAQPVWW